MLLTAAWSACAPPDRNRVEVFNPRDSAGVRIAENRQPQWRKGEEWRLATEPHLDIGRESGAGQDLDDVVGAVRLSDGRVAIADGGNHQIRIFDGPGNLVGTVGREGEGPGEFRSLSRFFLLPGDSLLALDSELRRLTVFKPSGELARTARLSEPASIAAGTPFLLLDNRTVLARPGFSFGSKTPSGAYRDTALITRYDLDGAFVDSAGRYPDRELFVHSEGSNALAGDMPFGKQTHYAAAPDGFYVGSADAYSIELRSPAGLLQAIVRVNWPNREVSAADVDRLKAPEPGASAENVLFWLRVLNSLTLPTRFPAYAGLATDRDGFLWVREYEYPPDSLPPTWQIFTSAGEWLGGLELPARFRITQIGPDEILGVWRDELDVEHVRAYRLQRTPRRAR